MSEDQKIKLQAQLWKIADELRGNMNADEFRDYILGFIFYKYLSEKMLVYANGILSEDAINYKEIQEATEEGQAYLDAVRDVSVEKIGYFLRPSELFSSIAMLGQASESNSNFLSSFNDKINAQIEKMKERKKGLLQQMFVFYVL